MHYWVKSPATGRLQNNPWSNIWAHELTTLLNFSMSLVLTWHCFKVTGWSQPLIFFFHCGPSSVTIYKKINSSSISMATHVLLLSFTLTQILKHQNDSQAVPSPQDSYVVWFFHITAHQREPDDSIFASAMRVRYKQAETIASY